LRTLVVQGPDRRLLQRLDRLIGDMAKAAEQGNWTSLTSSDLRFHETLVDGAKSKRLSRMYKTLMVESGMCLAMLRPAYTEYDSLVDEHRELRAALHGPDPEQSVALLRAHLADAVESLVKLSNQHDAADLQRTERS
jgi:DNA-binding GntR family transcriptional regulator